VRNNFFIYGGFTVISSGIGFVIIPLLSHYFSKEDFGRIGLFMIAMQLFTPIVGLSMNSIISRSYHLRDDLETLLGSALITIIFISTSVAFLLSIIPDSVYSYLSIDFQLTMIALLAAFFMIITATFLAILQMEGRAIQWGVATLINTIVSAIVTFMLIFLLEVEYMARLIGITLGQALAAFLSYIYVRQTINIKCTKSIEHYKYFLNLGVPLIFAVLSGWALISIDRVFIETMLGLDETGVYVFAVTLSSPVLIILATFTRVWAPAAFKELASKNEVGLFKRLILAFIAYIFVGLLFSMISPYIYKEIISDDFIPALVLLPWLIIGIVVQGLQSLLLPFIMNDGDTKIIAASALLGIVVNVLCNYFLIPNFGLIGAAVASILSSFTMSFIYLLYVSNTYDFGGIFIKGSRINE